MSVNTAESISILGRNKIVMQESVAEARHAGACHVDTRDIDVQTPFVTIDGPFLRQLSLYILILILY